MTPLGEIAVQTAAGVSSRLDERHPEHAAGLRPPEQANAHEDSRREH